MTRGIVGDLEHSRAGLGVLVEVRDLALRSSASAYHRAELEDRSACRRRPSAPGGRRSGRAIRPDPQRRVGEEGPSDQQREGRETRSSMRLKAARSVSAAPDRGSTSGNPAEVVHLGVRADHLVHARHHSTWTPSSVQRRNRSTCSVAGEARERHDDAFDAVGPHHLLDLAVPPRRLASPPEGSGSSSMKPTTSRP